MAATRSEASTSTSTMPFSLSTLRSHSIFLPSSSSASAQTEDDWELVNPPTDSLVGQKNSRMATRDKDLFVAVGKEVRMMSLAPGDGWEVRNGSVGTYKTLKSPTLTFTIHQIIPSPKGRLLAIVGHHQIVVLILPKPSYSGILAGEVECRSIPIDEFQFSPSSSDVITKVSWHPWGEGGNSLWVLTTNGKLREYDMLHPHDPVQTFHFLPEKGPSSAKFTAVDPLSRLATSFSFSTGTVDFGPLMVYVLVANGDIYTMGPILPLRAEVPLRYLQGLKAYADGRLAQIQTSAVDVFGAGEAGLGKATFQVQWIDSIIKQVKVAEETRKAKEEAEETPSRRTSLLGRSTRRESDASTSRSSRTGATDGMVRIHPPHLTEAGGPAPGAHRALLRQGPALFNPGPQEVGNDDDDDDQVASDLYVTTAGPDQDEIGTGETIVAIAWSGGRVDIGIEVEKPEPRWVSSRDPVIASPIIPIVESVLLPFPQVDVEDIASNAPTFLRDPLYSDVFYVQHSFGVDAISVRPWIDQLASDDVEELAGSEVIRLVESAGSPLRPIVGMFNFCNITLGYGLLALASSGQLASIELDLRIADSEVAPPAKTANKSETPSFHLNEPDSQSLLLAKAIDYDRLISSIRQPNQPYNPLNALRKRLPSSELTQPLTRITPEHLRALGEISSMVQQRSSSISQASQSIERRLDLSIQELQRQIRLLRDCQTRISSLKSNTTKIVDRAEGLMKVQGDLAGRLESVLGEMREEYRPQIGDVERKWFEELDRIKMRLRAGGGKALANRAQVLQEQLAAIKPLVIERQNTTHTQSPIPPSQTYGSRQLKPLEAALGARSEELRRLMSRLESLDIKVDAASGQNVEI